MQINKLLDLYLTFCKIGAVTFGGGVAMIPILERELIDKRNWMSSEEMMDYYAISQSTPGIIAVNVATFIGYKQAGNLGGIVATAGVVTPSLIIISIIANFIGAVNTIPWVQKALKGINVAVAANLSYATYKMARRTVKNLLGLLLFIIGFAAIYFFHISSIIVIFSAAAVGIISSWASGTLRIKHTASKTEEHGND